MMPVRSLALGCRCARAELENWPSGLAIWETRSDRTEYGERREGRKARLRDSIGIAVTCWRSQNKGRGHRNATPRERRARVLALCALLNARPKGSIWSEGQGRALVGMKGTRGWSDTFRLQALIDARLEGDDWRKESPPTRWPRAGGQLARSGEGQGVARRR